MRASRSSTSESFDNEFDDDDAVKPPRAGLPRLTTFEVVPQEIGPGAVKLDEASRAKLAAAGADPDQVEPELRGMKRGDKKERWYIAPTEEEEERIARGETVTFLVPADDQSP